MNTELEYAPTALYRFYDNADRLLYVGITHDIEQRWTSHARNQPWWLDVSRKTVDWHPNRSVAERLEDEALRRDKPLYDRSGKRWESDGVVDARLALETDRALAAIGAALDNGTFPDWKVMPPIGELSKCYKIPLVAVTKALGQLEHQANRIVRFGDRFVPGNPNQVPKDTARRYGGVYVLASRLFASEPFTMAQLTTATGYAAPTVEQHLRKLVKAQVVEKLVAAHRAARTFRVVVQPVPDPPKVLSFWGRDDVYALAEWLIRQLAADGQASHRDREIIEACLPDEYGVSKGGIRVLKVMARPYIAQPGCLPEWGIT